jgi:TRAP-type C4-dicarboxylate transport system permease small subunit
MAQSPSQTDAGLAPALEKRAGRFMQALAKGLAILGGLVLLALIVLSTISIAGRGLVGLDIGLGPVPGDFEIIEAGCAFAVFSFLPWCQIRRGHVTVDILARLSSERAQAGMELAGNFLMTAAAGLIAWRLILGMLDKQLYGDTTFILQFPAWWGYGASLPGAVLFAAVSAYTVWRSFNLFCTADRDRAGSPPGPLTQ